MATIQENHEVNCADMKLASFGRRQPSFNEDQGDCEFGSSKHMSIEYVDSQAFDLKIQPVIYYTDPMDTETLSSGLDEHLQVSLELMDQLNVSSELSHDLDVSSELVHMQPVRSDLVHSEPLGSEFDNSNDMDNVHLIATDMVDFDAQPNKPKRKRSQVWDHFELETVSEGCTRAFCKVCRQSYAYKTGSKVVGTSHLKRHIASEGCRRACAIMLRQQERIQLVSYTPKRTKAKPRRPIATDPPKLFDQERSRHGIARMFIMHEYPLNMVEHPGFIAFVRNLQPRFDMVDFSSLQGDCVDTYLKGKQNIQKIIDGLPGNISLALDVWTFSRLTGYIFLYGQFIDHDWKLHKLLLNIVMEPFPESDTALSHAVATCLSDWNMDNKLCSITLNQPVIEAGRKNLRGLLHVKNPLILNGQLLVERCIARTLSDMARDALAAGQDTVSKVRSSVKYVKASDVDEPKSLVLDNWTKWNTTYEMLRVACELKEVFSCVDTPPTMEDWKRADFICAHLKLLLEIADLLILAEAPPSTNVFFHEVWKIQLQLQSHAASDDPFVQNIGEISQERFMEYWKVAYLVLAIAVAMDPRYKMKLVEFYFTKLFGKEGPAYVKMVDEGIHDLFREYSRKADAKEDESLVSSNGFSEFDMYIIETSSHGVKSELDHYLEESVLPPQDLKMLGWWKLNEVKYPVLSKMARDILSIPLSSMGPDCVFNTVGGEMDEYRSSLRPETVEALMCAKSWMQHGQCE